MALPKDPLDKLILNQFIDKVLDEYDIMRSNIMNNLNLFSFQYCFNKYIEHFEKIL